MAVTTAVVGSMALGAYSASRSRSDANRAALIQGNTSLQIAELQANAGIHAAEIAAHGAAHAAGIQAAASDRALAENRRQYDETTERFAPYVQLGEQFIPAIRQASTVQGLSDRLDHIMDQSMFQGLRDERMEAANANLGAAGLRRSGAAAEEAADISMSTALGLEGMLFNRQAGNVAIGQAAAGNQAVAGQAYANTAANILTNSAAAQGQYIMQGAQAQAAGIQNAAYHQGAGLMGAANAQASGIINGANNRTQMIQGLTNLLPLIAGGGGGGGTSGASFGGYLGSGSFFSDERLKENLKPIGNIKGLTLFEWDWIQPVKDMIGMEMCTGFKAQEVQKKYPDCVKEYNGLLAVDYPKLHKVLEAA